MLDMTTLRKGMYSTCLEFVEMIRLVFEQGCYALRTGSLLTPQVQAWGGSSYQVPTSSELVKHRVLRGRLCLSGQ